MAIKQTGGELKMRDLKHLLTLEKFLDSAYNPLVRQACDEGMHAIGYTCYHMPEVLLNTEKQFPVFRRTSGM